MHKLVDSAEVESREMFIDVLNGLIVGGSVPPGEQACIVARLLEEIEHEDDPDNCAYIFGLLCSIRDNGVSGKIVNDGVVRRLHALRPAGLVHAIPLIGKSNRADKMVVLAPLMASQDAAVRDAIAELLHSSGR
jgi:hypothetical protein